MENLIVDLLPILHTYLGSSKKSSQRRGHENHAFRCPFCNHQKHKLEVDLTTGQWHCWVCDAKGKTPYSLLKRLNVPKGTLALVRTSSFSRERITKKEDPSFLQLPKDFTPLWKPGSGLYYDLAKKYLLEERKVTETDILRYQIGFAIEHPYSEMIIVPSFGENGKLNYFIGRSFRNWAIKKHNGPEVDKDFIGFELLINWEEPVVLVEGAFDAIAVRRNAIPLFGKRINEKLKTKILENKPKKLYIALDPDAIKDLQKTCEYFSQHGIETFKVDLKDGDPAELGFEKFWNEVEKAKLIKEEDNFSEKIRNLLR